MVIYLYTHNIFWLVVQFAHLENDGVKVNGKDDIPYMKWKIKFMFETTNPFSEFWTFLPNPGWVVV